MSRKITQFTDEIVHRYTERFESLSVIAAALHVAPMTVRRRLIEQGVRMRPQGGNVPELPHYEYDRTVALYRTGMSHAGVAAVMGISESAVRGRLAYAGVRRSRSEAQRLAYESGRRRPTGFPQVESEAA